MNLPKRALYIYVLFIVTNSKWSDDVNISVINESKIIASAHKLMTHFGANFLFKSIKSENLEIGLLRTLLGIFKIDFR